MDLEQTWGATVTAATVQWGNKGKDFLKNKHCTWFSTGYFHDNNMPHKSLYWLTTAAVETLTSLVARRRPKKYVLQKEVL